MTTRRILMTGSARAALAGGLMLAAVPAWAQDVVQNYEWINQTTTLTAMPESRGPALAPTENTIDSDPISDGAEINATPAVAAPRAPRITIRNDNAPADTQPATLLADHVTLSGERRLTAEGGVVVWHQGARLVAERVIYDGATGQLQIDGPIHLTRPELEGSDQDVILIADQAQLSDDFKAGLLQGARMVLAREMQLAANEVELSGQGRFITLRHVVASSCRICATDPVPLWEIRARSITHDSETRLLHFEHPQLRAFGLPIAAIPATVTAPDPTVERKSGFLRPEVRTTSALGFGVKVPYFWTLGDHADLTLTPYISASRTNTLEFRYRRAMQNGAMQWNGGISDDDLTNDDLRGYLFGGGRFLLPDDYRLGFQLQVASDRAYLLDYDITDADRLWSGITLDKVTRDRLVHARIGNYHSLRAEEDNSSLPTLTGDALWQNRFRPGLIGGAGTYQWSVHAHHRTSDDDGVGRDMGRASFGLDWRRTDVLPGGLVAAVQTSLDADIFGIWQDSAYDNMETRVLPQIGAELAWPLSRSDAAGATHVVQPIAQLIWAPEINQDDIPNEDATLIEFDEGNLMAFDRFPGYDRRETGLRANLGLAWTRFDPRGWNFGMTAGRVLRAEDYKEFSPSGPLGGKQSDWLLAAHYNNNDGLAIANRALFDDNLSLSRNELRMGWLRPGLQLSLGYLWIDADAAEDRAKDVSELAFDSGWQVADGWWAIAEGRYDFSFDRTQRAELGLQYRNECVTVDFGVRRRFSSAEELRADTDLRLSVKLGGFGVDQSGQGTVARRNCVR